MRTRFAPSPSGDLHVGGAWTALASWVVAQRVGGDTALRIEDLDLARTVPGAQARIEDDLRWLGLTWDLGPVVQSERTALYEGAVEALKGKGLIYPCDCSRAEIARAANAPHAGEESVYPGTCRGRSPTRRMKRPPALRVKVPDEVVEAADPIAGAYRQHLAGEVGDFVVQRGDGVFAYQLAVVVDDAAMGISDVVRGADLLSSTPRQMWLARTLDVAVPRYLHVPMVLAAEGGRLEKRAGGVTIASLRALGLPPEHVIGALAHGLGLAAESAPATAAAIAASVREAEPRWRRTPWTVPGDWLDRASGHRAQA